MATRTEFPVKEAGRLCGLLALVFLWACEDEVMAPSLVPALSADRAVAVAETDREALVALYNATDGPNWERKDNWLTDAALTEWYGVVANSLGQVRWLTLSDNGLKGPVVPELGSLSALEFLGLGENELTGEVPAELADATRLTGLWINDNRITGIIPSTFLTLSQLRVLDLSGNDGLCIPSTARFSEWTDSVSQLSGPDCSEADAEVLRVLYEATGGGLDNWTNSSGWLSEAVLSEWHGVEIDSVGRVSGLDLSENGLSGQLPDSLVELSVLVSLDLSDNTLSGSLPDSLGKLSALTRLDVSGNGSMAGRLPQSLTALELDELRYSDTRLCVPEDAEFQEWLNGIRQHEGSGRECPPTSQYDILAAIYEATNGPKWANNDNWLTDAPLGEWYGVGTDSDGQVTSLYLGWNFLQGQIPPEIGGLSSLNYLGLGGSYALTGPLPEELYDLPELRTLYLGAFNLGGTLPPEIARLTQLEELYLWDAGLGGPLPTEITQLANLRRLDLSYNDLLGSIPPELGKLTELESLYLRYNDLVGGIPPELGDLTNLRRLELDNNRLDGAIPEELAKLVNLRTLSLHKNDLEGAIPAGFGALTELESLWLAMNPRLSGPLPDSLVALDALESLRAGSTSLCAPDGEEFLAWLNEIEFHRVARCELGATVYLTQSVQSLKFPVPLVAGRSALLRVFVFSPYAAGQRMPDVRATFYRNDEQVHTVDIEGGGAALPTELDESSLAHSANADIPGDVLQPGLEMVIEVDPDGTLGLVLGMVKRMPATGRLAVDVREMPDFQLTLVPFLYEAEPDSSILEITAGMANDPEGHPMFKDTRALLPIGDFDVMLHDPVVSSTDNGFQLLRDTEAIRLMEGRAGYWLAMLAPLPRGGLLGVADGIGSWTSFSIPLSRTIAHEFGHNMNLRHAPCGGAGGPDPLFPDRNGRIGAWGYDRVSGRLFSPYATDLMSYCRGGWISGYHVSNSLGHRLDAETGASAEKTRSVIVWGGRDADGTLFLEPAFVVDAIPKLPPMGGEFQLRGRTDSGGEAFSFSFDMPYIPDVDDERSSFVFAVPVTWTDALTSISLAGGYESVALDQASYSPMTILRDPATGQVRAILREPEAAAMGAFGMSEAQRLEVLFSSGIPEVPERRR